jgi:hypothetical protein
MKKPGVSSDAPHLQHCVARRLDRHASAERVKQSRFSSSQRRRTLLQPDTLGYADRVGELGGRQHRLR